MSPRLPVVSGAETVAALRKAGFEEISQRGSHVKLRSAEATVIVPLHQELAPGTLRSVLRQLGMAVEDFTKLLCNPPAVEDDLGFIGGATFYQGDVKMEVVVRRHWANDATGAPCRWWGVYEDDTGDSLSTGEAYARFSDGSEAAVRLRTASAGAGDFEVVGRLEDSTQVNRRV